MLGVHLADRGAVRAFHVVGINLQLRLSINRGAVGQQQVFIGLLRVRFIRALVHVNATMKHRTRIVIEDAVKIFVTVAMRLRVIHYHVMINQLPGPRQVQAVEHGLNASAVEMGAQIVSGNAASQRERMMRHAGVAAECGM